MRLKKEDTLIRKDYHIHTSYSDDCSIPMEKMIESAINKGLTEIALTDHVDFDSSYSLTVEAVDYDKYTKEFSYLKDKYKDKIDLLLGVEIGLSHVSQTEIASFLSGRPFDFVIGSIHSVDGSDVYLDSNSLGKSQRQTYTDYFESVLKCSAMMDCYDVFGHLDYINRYGSFKDRILNYRDYSDIIDEILKTVIDKGKGFEINTSGYRYGLDQLHPQVDIIKRYKELGGEILTIGSDSHKPQDIAADFDTVYAVLQSLGIRYLAEFRQRKAVMYKI